MASLILVIGGGTVSAQPRSLDLVVLVDTSASMFPYWHDTTDYLIRNILTEVLRKGDSFHLISFASHPSLEISRRIESQADIRAILARYLLLQPLGRYTDLVAAIQYLYQYVIDLPMSAEKEIIILTDGIDDPPPDSSYPITGAKNLARDRRLVVETAQEMRRLGWKIHIIQYPIAGAAPLGPPQPGVQLLTEATTPPAGVGAPIGAAAGAAAHAASPGGYPGGAAHAPIAPGNQRATAAGRSAEVGPAGSSGAAAASAYGGSTSPPSGSPAGAAAEAGTAAGAAAGRGAGAKTQGASGSAQAVPPAAGQAPLLSALSQTLGVPIQQYEGVKKENLANVATGSPEVLFPKNLGKVGYRAIAPFVIRNFQGQPIFVRLKDILYGGMNILRHPVDLPVKARGEATLKAPLELPSTMLPGAHSIEVRLEFSDTLRESPRTGTLAFTLRRGLLGPHALSAYVVPVLIGLLLLAVIAVIILFVRRIAADLAAAPRATALPKMHFDATGGAIHPIELRVTGQNPNIGARNIHPIGLGSRRTVGGGGSAFLIYLYRCPAHIAEIVREGDSYTFLPIRTELFPQLAGELANCLGREIVVQLDGDHRVTIIFRRYVSPLDEVNRIMHLVDQPGTRSSAT